MKQTADVPVELFQFSEQSALDIGKLKKSFSSRSASNVSVLLLAIENASYLWFDKEHSPRNVELCAALRELFPGQIKFVVCPTSKKAGDAWKSHIGRREPSSILGDSLRPSAVQEWHGFDPGQDCSKSNICSLTCKEDQGNGAPALRRPEKPRFAKQLTHALMAAVLLACVSALWVEKGRTEKLGGELTQLRADSAAEKKQLQQKLDAAEKDLTHCRADSTAEKKQCQQKLDAAEKDLTQCRVDSTAEKKQLQSDLTQLRADKEKLGSSNRSEA